ncbi:hypothetical protein B9Z55_015815 [Caenorhabditis nigoni]|uniref:Uncharacterized protein n=1 Tax=Caenorhabditis nigoni TaxID=1611254 RepID=A0A2G5UBV8_9PELO|nr:hypothetical protein B9Z55_015815 [Caenorhabditis nigoni]
MYPLAFHLLDFLLIPYDFRPSLLGYSREILRERERGDADGRGPHTTAHYVPDHYHMDYAGEARDCGGGGDADGQGRYTVIHCDVTTQYHRQ